MHSRQRIINAIEFNKVDKIPVEFFPCSAGLYEHGDKLRQLLKRDFGDFGDVSDMIIEEPKPEHFDKDGRYHMTQIDDWGINWEYRIFGRMGHALNFPLSDITKVEEIIFPKSDFSTNEDLIKIKNECAIHKQNFFCRRGSVSIFERMIALRNFEDVLVDLVMDTTLINRLADKITDYYIKEIQGYIQAGVDSISFSDDYGTGENLLISPKIFKRFFRPRYQKIIDIAKTAGVKVHFHSCGNIKEILDDFAEMGINSIWPQLPLYDRNYLSGYSKSNKVAIALHPDRGELMTRQTPKDIQKEIHSIINDFDIINGGSWMYIEIDHGFPFENAKALIETVLEYR